VRKLKKLTTGDIVAGVCSILLVVLAFTSTWAKYTIEVFGTSESEGATLVDSDAFSALAWLAVLAALVGAVVFIMRATSGKPANAGMIYMVLGVITLLALVILVVTGPKDITGALEEELGGISLDDLGDLGGFSVEAGRGFMLYVGVLLAAGVAVGGFMLKGMSSTTETPSAPTL
jgi:hypothetical protein